MWRQQTHCVLFVWPASTLLFVCVHVTASKRAGSHCVGVICPLCCMHSSACSPSRSMLWLCSPPFLLLGYSPPFFSPFFFLVWQNSLLGKGKLSISEAPQSNKPAANEPWLGESVPHSTAITACSMCELLEKTAGLVRSPKDRASSQFFTSSSTCEKQIETNLWISFKMLIYFCLVGLYTV